MGPVGRGCTCISDCDLRKLEGVALRDLLQRSPLPLILAVVGNCLGRGIHYPFCQSDHRSEKIMRVCEM